MHYSWTFALMVVAVVGKEEFHEVEVTDGNRILRANVSVNDVILTAEVKIGDVSSYPDVHRTESFHDFNYGYHAVKDYDDNKCYIRPSNHSLTTFLSHLNDAAQRRVLQEYRWGCEHKPMPPDLIRFLAGPHIQIFCKNMDTLLITKETHLGSSKETRGSSIVKRYCYICFFSTDCPYFPSSTKTTVEAVNIGR